MKLLRVLTIALTMSFALIGCRRAPPENLLVNAARNDDLGTFRSIAVQYPASINKCEQGMLGYTPLIASVLTDGTNVFNYLLSIGANVNAPNREGEPPLMVATTKGDANSAKIAALIQAGANVNAKDLGGHSVIQCANAARATNIVAILKSHGAKE